MADAEALLQMREHLIAAAQHAGNIGANLDVILADGLAAQHRVISHRLGNLSHVQVEPPRDFSEHVIADESVIILRVHHHRDQRRALERIAAD